MWKTLRRNRATTSSHAEFSLRRQRSMSSVSEATFPSSKASFRAAGHLREPTSSSGTAPGTPSGERLDDSGIAIRGSTRRRRRLLHLGFARLDPRGVPVAAHRLRRLVEERALDRPDPPLHVLVVGLGVARLAPVGQLLLVL